MEKGAKKMERKPRWEDYECKPFSTIKDIANQLEAYSTKLEKYCDHIEKERSELRLKEEIAHTAKDIAQDAHQKSQKELQALKYWKKEFHGNMFNNPEKGRILQHSTIEDAKEKLTDVIEAYKELGKDVKGFDENNCVVDRNQVIYYLERLSTELEKLKI